MAKSPIHRLPALIAAAVAASAFAAAPALATEGPTGPAPDPTLIAPVTPFPGATPTPQAPRVIQRAQLGQRGQLRIRLKSPSRLRVTVLRGSKGHRVRTINVKAGRRTVSLRPTRNLRPGRYRVRVVAIDAHGVRSRPITRTIRVRR